MKKFFVVLLILAVAAGGVFAQEFKLTGEVRSGIMFKATDVEDSEPETFVYSSGGGHIWRMTFNGAYTNADKTAGFNFNLRSNGGTPGGSGASTYAENARAWLKALDGKVTFFGGKTDDSGVLDTNGGVDTTLDLGAGRGLFTRFTPSSELTLGLGIYPNFSMGNANGILLQQGDYALGAAFTVPDVVTLVALGRSNGNNNNGQNDYVSDHAPENAPQFDAAIAAQVLALKSAGISTLILDAAFFNVTQAPVYKLNSDTSYTFEGDPLDTSAGSMPTGGWPINGTVKSKTTKTWVEDTASMLNKMMEISIGQKIVFVKDALEIGGRFQQRLLSGKAGTWADNDYYAADLSFYVWGFYKLNEGKIIPRLDAGYNIGSGPYDNKGVWKLRAGGSVWDGLGRGLFSKDAANLVISPSVEFRVGGSSNQMIQLGYGLFNDMTKNLPSNAQKMQHIVYADYKVSF